MFFDQFSDFLEHSDSLPGKPLLMGDFNFHFENVENNSSRKLHDTIDMFNLTSPFLNLLTTKAICLT